MNLTSTNCAGTQTLMHITGIFSVWTLRRMHLCQPNCYKRQLSKVGLQMEKSLILFLPLMKVKPPVPSYKMYQCPTSYTSRWIKAA